MADVHVVDALAREAWGNLLAFLLDIKDQGKEPLDIGWVHVVAVRALD
jgi:hypothetical protein